MAGNDHRAIKARAVHVGDCGAAPAAAAGQVGALHQAQQLGEDLAIGSSSSSR
jgi:hypothetical protein